MPRLSSCLRALVLGAASLFVALLAPAQTSVSIHDVMQSLPGGPYLGKSVSTSGIVVGVMSGSSTGGAAFYISEPSSNWDSLRSTAEGMPIWASTVSACNGVADGDSVTVVGTVTNGTLVNAANTPGTGITPTSCTKSGTATMTQSIDLANFGALTSFGDALFYTGMSATDKSFVAISPSGGSISGSAMVGNGQFWGVLSSGITTNGHMFRLTGIAKDEYTPTGAPAGVPSWSGNPQRILIDTTTFGGSAVNITVGQTITCSNTNTTGKGATAGIGLIDYTLGYARLLIFKETTCSVSGTVATSVSAAADTTHFKVGTLDVNTFLGSASLFATALQKATLAVSSVFGSPDIMALQEVGDQTTLQTLAAAVNTTNSGSTAYVATVVGTDTVNSGFLINTNTVKNTAFREVGRGATYTTASGGSATLWDHPPLVATGEFVRIGKNYPVTIVNIHMASRDNIGDSTLGPDVRTHRAAQAAFVSSLVQQYQSAGANVIVAGNVNAYEYNDGYVDVTGILDGSPAAATAVTLYQASSTTAALHDFTTDVTANTRYNVIERGNAAATEHILASNTVTDSSTASASLASYVNTVTQPHFSTDYAATSANSATTPAGLTPHDGFLVNFAIPPVPTTASISPTSINFGDVDLGASASQTATVSNTTTFTSTVTISNIAISGTNASDFTQTSTCTTLSQGSTCTVTVTFTPSALGTRSATLTVTNDSTSNGTLTVSLTGNGIDTTATLTPASATFATTAISATSAAKVFTFTNTSQIAETVNSVAVTGDYSVSSNGCTASVAASGTCAIAVVFKPTAAGTRTGTLTVTNSSTGNPTLTASLTATGLDTTATLTPTSATFANTYAGGGVSAAQTFTVTNTSPIAITVKSASITAGFTIAANNCPATLAAAATCTLAVTFTPTTAGAQTGTLTVLTNTSANPTLTAQLSGTGLPTTAALSPTGADFGTQILNTTSSAAIFTWSNTSAVALTVNSVSASGDYSISSTTCNGQVAANSACTISVVFTPTVLRTRTGTLTVTSTASANPSLTASLTGIGVANVQADITALNFGNIDVGYTSDAQTVTITNYTNAAIALTGITLTGDYADTTSCGAVLAGRTSCTVSIVFKPTATGVRAGTLSITTNDTKYPLITVTLTGNGVDFSIALAPTSGNIIAGKSVTGIVATTTAIGGFNAQVVLSCSTKAQGSACDISPATFTLSGATNSAVTISTTSKYTVIGYGSLLMGRGWLLWLMGGVAAGILLAARRRAVTTLLLLLFGLGLVGGITGCSGKYPDMNSPYTEPGTYDYTVTVTDGKISHTATYSLTVTAK